MPATEVLPLSGSWPCGGHLLYIRTVGRT
jgi:hypothetical protein